VLAVTFLATLLVELEFAIYVGRHPFPPAVPQPDVHPHFHHLAPDPDSERRSFINITRKPVKECPSSRSIRIDGSLFFGPWTTSPSNCAAMTRNFPEQAHILIEGSGINFIDVAGCEAIANEAHRLHVSGRQLYLCTLKGEV